MYRLLARSLFISCVTRGLGMHQLINIIILSQYNIKINDKWAYSVTGSIRTQLLEGINFESDVLDKISDFMAPGYLNLNLGFKYTESFLIFIKLLISIVF